MNKPLYKHRYLPYLLIAPQLAVTLIFFIWPALESVRQAFYQSSFWGTIDRFVGFKNFIQIFANTDYLYSFCITLFFSFAVAILAMLTGLLFAVLVSRILRGQKSYKTLLIWPYAVAPAVAGVLWGFLFNPAIGIVTYVLSEFGIHWNYFTNGYQALSMSIIASAWQQVSYNFLFFLAGLAAIPKSLLEAAAIDGAGPFKRFWHVVLPLISPTTFFLIVMNLVYAFFDTFGLISTMTQGGPSNSTNILVYKVYQDGFIGQQLGSSSAQSVILMFIVIALAVIQFKYIEKKVHY